MNRRFIALMASLVLLATIGTGCIGRFALSGKVRAFNLEATEDRWGREILFVCLYVIPVYPFAGAIDMIIVNSIEFWTGTNPIDGGESVTPVAQNDAQNEWTTEEGTQITMIHRGDDSIDVTLISIDGEERYLNLKRTENGVVASDAAGEVLADSTDPLVRQLQATL
ncbi:MAG: DUF3332 family protein [Deltaproteobacteria bacterium]|nr:DUF3332 family protein [Deltaproteobacteria bacterium]